MSDAPTNTAPGSAGQNGAHLNAFPAPCYATHNHVPETATERLIKAALELVERDLCFIGNTISIPTLSHSEGIRRIRELREAAFAAIEELQ